MKCEVMPCLVQIEESNLKKLCAQVKETLAKELVTIDKKKSSFNLADLWNTRKNMYTANKLWRNKARIYTMV